MQDSADVVELLGTVNHEVQMKCQNRGSLHAYILSWLHADVVIRVTLRDDATFPTVHAESSAEQLRLRDMVLQAQIHNCMRMRGCSVQGRCKYGFPQCEASINEEGGRWEYVDSGEVDHAKLLHYWDAQLNVQCVTGKDCSYYLLKYAPNPPTKSSWPHLQPND